MGLKINQILAEYDAMPNQEGWDILDETFRMKYREMQAYMADHNNDTSQRTPEIAEMDDELCQLFNELHDIEAIEDLEDMDESDIETENQSPDTDDPAIEETEQFVEPETEVNTGTEQKTENPEIETENKIEMENQNVPDEIKSGADAPLNNENINVTATQEQSPTFIQDNGFEAWALSQETISAKDLRKWNIPEGLWKIDKPEFQVGNIVFRKTVAGLLFNKWQVVKTQ
jgi:hypothetical protein